MANVGDVHAQLDVPAVKLADADCVVVVLGVGGVDGDDEVAGEVESPRLGLCAFALESCNVYIELAVDLTGLVVAFLWELVGGEAVRRDDALRFGVGFARLAEDLGDDALAERAIAPG